MWESVGDVRWIRWNALLDDFCGKIGKVWMWEFMGYKKHPTDCCRGFLVGSHWVQLCFRLALQKLF